MYKEVAIPELLSTINNCPESLYVLGNFDKLPVCVAIVGSRHPTREGESIAFDLANQLAGQDIAIVSGLARGIDAAAHRGTITAGGRTIAVIPSGIKVIYPRSHYALARAIIKHSGAIVSEFNDERQPKPHDFLARNRLIAGLAQLTIVIEAASRSGSLNTANHALENNRDVMAVPGSINNPLAAGTNRLIQQGAEPLTSVNDVFDMLGLAIELDEQPTTAHTEEEKRVIDILTDQTLAYSEVVDKLDMDIAKTQATISQMELKGSLKRLPGNYLRLSG